MTHADLMERISGEELQAWMAFYQIEPFGEQRADYRTGIVASTIANANRDPKKRRNPFRPEDFLPEFQPASRKKTGDIMGHLKRWMMGA